MPETQWMTLTETADMMKRLPDQVTQMCEDGRLEYYMEDGRYFVSRESIDVFMHPPAGEPAPADPDTNGTARRRYGRAPHDIEPSPESVTDLGDESGPDEAGAAGVVETGDILEDAPGRDDELSVEAEDPAETEHGMEAEDLAETEDVVETENVRPPEDLAVIDDEELVKNVVEPEDGAARPDENPPGENAGPEPSTQDGEQAEAEEYAGEQAETAEDPGAQTEAAEDPGEPDVRVAEILADLRAALSRHALEHKAFCDEIAGLADALESTLSQDDDKTNELTREISNLLARYTRR